MLNLQIQGAHNINLVTPTHFIPQIIESLWNAVQKGLHIPIVYNSSGYDDLETLKLLDGIIDIYLPDMKYGTNRNAEKYSSAKGYVEINRNAITEMYRQAGELCTDAKGIAQRGLIIRHLVLPGNISNTYNVLEFIAQLSPTIPVSLMSQYFPAFTAPEIPELKKKLRENEYEEASKLLDRFGLVNGWIQPVE
jgi:putative pyruvate formate lyase activating enzyme